MSDLHKDFCDLLFDEDIFFLERSKTYRQIYKNLFPLIVKKIRVIPDNTEEGEEDNKYEQQYSENNVKNPKVLNVEITFINDNLYEGESLNGRLEGNGLFKWPDNTFYKGTFENNRMTGHGLTKYPHNRTFDGELYVSERHGYGTFLTDTFKYNGYFKCGHLNGTGTLKSLKESFEGKFINNIFHKGIRSGDFGTFEGIFNKIGEKKFGVLSLKTGDLYKGHWLNGKYHKFGIYEWGFIKIDVDFIKLIPNRYVGFWKNNMRHGVGMLEFDERKIFCYWEFDCKQGPGIIMAANGDIFISDKMFKNDELKNVKKIIKTKEICCLFTDFLRIFDNPEKYLDNPDYKFPLDRDTFTEKVAFFMHFSSELDPTIMPLFLPNYVIDISEIPAIRFAEKNLPAVDSNLLKEKEINSFIQVIISNYDDLLKLYKHYGNFGLGYKFEHIAITRLGLWQFYRDIISTSVSINILQHVEECDNTYHTLVIDRYNPSELIYFWQFIRHLIHLIITLNNLVMENNCLKERPSFFGLIGTTMLIFLREKEEMEYFKFKMVRSLMERHPKAFAGLLDQIKAFEIIPITIRTVFRYVKKFSQEDIKGVSPALDHIHAKDFIECSQKLFPYMIDGSTLMETLFPVTILEFIEIILLLFGRNIENKRREYFYNIYLQQLMEEEEERAASLSASTKKDKNKNKKGKK